MCFPGALIPGLHNVPQRLVINAHNQNHLRYPVLNNHVRLRFDFVHWKLAIIQVFLSVLKFDNLNMVSMHYKLRLWCSSLYLNVVFATLATLRYASQGETP